MKVQWGRVKKVNFIEGEYSAAAFLGSREKMKRRTALFSCGLALFYQLLKTKVGGGKNLTLQVAEV